MSIKDIVEKAMHHNCAHEHVKWINSVCMIAGYKKEGICLDCGAQLLKKTDGSVIKK